LAAQRHVMQSRLSMNSASSLKLAA
jgi:hypothetical protein